MLTQEEINAMMLDDDEEDDSSSEEISQSEIEALINSSTDDNKETVEEKDVKDTINDDLDKSNSVDKNDSVDNIESSINNHSNETPNLINSIPSTNKAPDDKEHRVVDQLTEVTEEGEKKASEMFDLIAKASDGIMEIDEHVAGSITNLNELLDMLNILHQKFPNIAIFKENIDKTNNTIANLEKTIGDLAYINNDIFAAMELMQYQDITRQKIERVISIIRDLSSYINDIFADTHKKEIQAAHHISGDMNDDLVGLDEIDDLISSFKKG